MLRNSMDRSEWRRIRALIHVTSSLFLFSVVCIGLTLGQKNSERVVHVVDIGRKSYAISLKIQEFVINHVRTSPDQTDGVIIMVEHDPVYTVGQRDEQYGDEYLYRFRSLGADFHRTNRGGLMTFHGPGQLVVYPILNMNTINIDLQSYIFLLEEMVISTCAKFGVKASRIPDLRGVWVEDRKICAIGVHVGHNITSHGFALECETDLKWYDNIMPCGIADKDVTTLTAETKKRVRTEDVKDLLLQDFAEIFDCRVEEAPDELAKEIRSLSRSR